MSNVGPLNGASKLKTGKEFVTNLFQSDSEGEGEDNEEERDDEEEDGEEGEEGANAATSGELEKNSSSVKQEKLQFKDDSQKILLNLSKPTLRNIVMLICDEAVII